MSTESKSPTKDGWHKVLWPDGVTDRYYIWIIEGCAWAGKPTHNFDKPNGHSGFWVSDKMGGMWQHEESDRAAMRKMQEEINILKADLNECISFIRLMDKRQTIEDVRRDCRIFLMERKNYDK